MYEKHLRGYLLINCSTSKNKWGIIVYLLQMRWVTFSPHLSYHLVYTERIQPVMH